MNEEIESAFEPRRPEIQNFGPGTKQRINRNINESTFFKLYQKDQISQDQYEAGCRFLAYHSYGQSNLTSSYKPFSYGSGSKLEDFNIGSIDAATFCAKIPKIIGMFDYKLCRDLIVEDMRLMQLYPKTGFKSTVAAKERLKQALQSLADNIWKAENSSRII